MVRKLRSLRWNGTSKHPVQQEGAVAVVDRNYVDFGDQVESEEAVERWLTSPASHSKGSSRSLSSSLHSQSTPPVSSPTSNSGRAKVRSPSQEQAMESSATRMAKKYNPMQGKRILKERLQSRSRLNGNGPPRQAATVTPPGIREKMAGAKFAATSIKSPATSATTSSSSSSDDNRVFNFKEFDFDADSIEALPSKEIVSVVSHDSSSCGARHPRRSIDNLHVETSTPLGALPRELPQPPKKSQYHSPHQPNLPQRSVPRRPSLGRAATNRRPSAEAVEDKKRLLVSRHRPSATTNDTETPNQTISRRPSNESPERRNSKLSIAKRSSGASVGTELTTTTTTDSSKKSFFSSSSRRKEAESVATEKTSETKKSFFGRKPPQNESESVRSGTSSANKNAAARTTAKSIRTEITVVEVRNSPVPDVPDDRYMIQKAEEALRQMDEEREKQDRIHAAYKQQQQPSRQPMVPARTNRIKLNVYDLLASEVVMQLPWGCHFPIGQCFNVVNSALHNVGTGAYHVGVEINGVEYAYGANQTKGATGIFSCMPRHSPGYQFRTTIDFGERVLIRNIPPNKRANDSNINGKQRQVDGREVLREMADDYLGLDYDLFRKNCCTFAHDACRRLGVKEEEIPSWFRNLCVAGALTQDAANSTIEPITQVFSACGDMDGNVDGVGEELVRIPST